MKVNKNRQVFHFPPLLGAQALVRHEREVFFLSLVPVHGQDDTNQENRRRTIFLFSTAAGALGGSFFSHQWR